MAIFQKDYKDLAQILDKKTDCIYQTITGFNNKYEEPNILTAQEKLDAAKWFNEQGFFHELAVNPYMPDKCTVEDIKKMIEYVNPKGFVMRDYHTTSKVIMRKNFPPEYPKDVMEKARAEIRAYCCEKNILHDIDYIERLPYSEEALKSFELNLRVASNEHTFSGNGFVHTEMLGAIFKHFERTGDPRVVFGFDAYLDFYAKQIKYFEGCVIKRSDHSVSTSKTSRQWSKENMSITDFVRGRWNWGKFEMADYFKDKDGNGNIYYLRHREGLEKLMEVKHDKENGD